PFHKIGNHLFKSGPRQSLIEVLGTGAISRNEGQVDIGLHGGGEFTLAALRSLLQPLQGQAIVAEINPVVFLKLGDDPLDDLQIEIFSAQKTVAAGCKYLENSVIHFQDGDIKRPTTEIIDCDFFVLAFSKSVGEGSRGGLVDDPTHIQTCDFAGIL